MVYIHVSIPLLHRIPRIRLCCPCCSHHLVPPQPPCTTATTRYHPITTPQMLSFHFLNYGPGQSEADPSVFPESAFSAVWEGFLTADCTVKGATFGIAGRYADQTDILLYIDTAMVLNMTNEKVNYASSVDVTQGKAMQIRLEYSQPDATGAHPAFALQWSLQGQHPVQDAVNAVNANDASVVVVGGGTGVTSGEGIDRASLGLPGAQLAFLQTVYAAAVAANKPMAVVVVQGKAFGEMWMKESLPAILEAWQSGQGQGQAIAETLFGDNNPAGRTAVTFPVSADVLPVYYNHKPTASRGGYSNPPSIPGGSYPPTAPSSASILWSFGHGLSYGATFHYSDVTLSAPSVPAAGGEVIVSFTVTNNGTLAAEEVVQMYVRDEIASVTTPVMQLRGFERLPSLAPGASVKVALQLDVARDLWLIDLDMRKVVEPGNFSIMVGGASDKIQLRANLTVV